MSSRKLEWWNSLTIKQQDEFIRKKELKKKKKLEKFELDWSKAKI